MYVQIKLLISDKCTSQGSELCVSKFKQWL